VPVLSFRLQPSVLVFVGDLLTAAYIVAIKLFSPC